MKKLIFFMKCADYGCHYGDLFTSKGYIQQIVNELKTTIDIKYWHECHPKALLDLGLDTCQLDLSKEDFSQSYIERDDILYVNLWTAQREEFSGKVGVNHEFLQRAWKKIFDKINSFHNVNLVLHNMEYYVASIDYSFFRNNEKLSMYLKNSANKKILISNGPATSGQSFADNMSSSINALAASYKNFDFICTSKFKTKNSNIKFTDDIIDQGEAVNKESSPRPTCDINEISYLSTFCDIIVGKNSGPFIYCLTKDNLFDDKKIIISFHKRKTDDMLLYLKYKCKYFYYKLYEKNYSPNVVLEVLKEKIQSV